MYQSVQLMVAQQKSTCFAQKARGFHTWLLVQNNTEGIADTQDSFRDAPFVYESKWTSLATTKNHLQYASIRLIGFV
jgi:hypothetical protein